MHLQYFVNTYNTAHQIEAIAMRGLISGET